MIVDFVSICWGNQLACASSVHIFIWAPNHLHYFVVSWDWSICFKSKLQFCLYLNFKCTWHLNIEMWNIQTLNLLHLHALNMVTIDLIARLYHGMYLNFLYIKYLEYICEISRLWTWQVPELQTYYIFQLLVHESWDYIKIFSKESPMIIPQTLVLF